MNVGDGLAEGDHLIAQRDQESLETIRIGVRLRKRLRSRNGARVPSD
nr:hypothetical protein XF12B_67900 [Bradyrhizobium diazoefficiens]